MEKDKLKFEAIDRHTDELIKSLVILKKMDESSKEVEVEY